MAVNVEALYREFGPMVLRRCRSLLKNEEQAVEAMQDTFVHVLKRADRLEVHAPSSLLYRAATNTCLNEIRRAKRHPTTADEELLARIAAAPEEEGTVARQMLDRLFRTAKPSTRTIAVLHLLDGMTLEEVAAEVGLSVSGVRLRLRNLRAHVHELEELG